MEVLHVVVFVPMFVIEGSVMGVVKDRVKLHVKELAFIPVI